MEASRLPWLQLGTLLIRDGVITREQLDEALAEKDRTGRRVGDILIDGGLATTADMARALAEQYGLEYVDVNTTEPEPEMRTLLPEEMARRYRALPLKALSKNLVLVAVSDPTDIMGLDNVKLALGVNLKFCISDPFALEAAIEHFYGGRPNLRIVEDPAPVTSTIPSGNVFDLEDVEDDAAPAIKFVNEVLHEAIKGRASDIHFEPGENDMVVRVRVDGVTRELVRVPQSRQASTISRLKVMAQLDIAERRVPQDGRASVKVAGEPVDLRVAVLPTTHGEKVVVRILQRQSARVHLTDLGMSQQAFGTLMNAIDQPFGAIIACGPTGAGKTTTLYAALEHLNTPDKVVTTIEDPVEYELEGVAQMQVNTKAGMTFARGLRTILRADPDVLLVGEIRDAETAEIAIQAAMTGHLVLSTVHAQNASSALARLEDMGIEPFMLSNAINCIVAQRLVRKLCESCRSMRDATDDEKVEMGIASGTPVQLGQPRGCPHCNSTGYHGRTAIYEVLPMTSATKALVGRPIDEIHAEAKREGMVTLRQDGFRLALAGITSLQEVRRVIGSMD